MNPAHRPAPAYTDPDWHLATSYTAWVNAIAVAVFVAHLAVVEWGPYGPHRDALLYYAMGERLRLFAMDAPPLIALVARATRALGDSELLTHVPVAGAHALVIGLAASFARRAGGGAGAQVLTALAVATAPVFMRAGSLFQPVVFDQLWWTASLAVLARLGGGARTAAGIGGGGLRDVTPLGADPAGAVRRRWLWLGVLLGLGLLTKFTILVLAAGTLVAIVATPLRRHLLTPWPWLAAALTLVIGSPSIIGQATLGWPFLAQLDDLAVTQLARVTPGSFALEQLLMVGPVVLLAAAVAPATTIRGRDVGRRAVAWAAVVSFALMLLVGGKAYYIAPIWPALLGLAIGGTDAWVRRRREAKPAGRVRRLEGWLVRGTLWAVVVAYGVVALPLGLPFLPPEPMARYAAALGVTGAVTTNVGERLELPQDYADMLGWEELAAATGAVWRALPPAERGRAVILATNYGRAGAIDWFGSDDLPAAISPAGSYWFWGPGDRPGDVAVVVGAEVDEIRTYYRSVVEVARVQRPWGVTEERDVPIVVARRPVRPLRDVWSELREP